MRVGVFSEHRQVLRDGLHIPTNNRPAERVPGAEARVVFQSLAEDRQALPSRILARESGGASYLLQRHQEREKKWRSKSRPRVIGRFASGREREALATQ